jgi:hypothetical protein
MRDMRTATAQSSDFRTCRKNAAQLFAETKMRMHRCSEPAIK